MPSAVNVPATLPIVADVGCKLPPDMQPGETLRLVFETKTDSGFIQPDGWQRFHASVELRCARGAGEPLSRLSPPLRLLPEPDTMFSAGLLLVALLSRWRSRAR